MIDARLFVREGVHQVKEAIEVADHGGVSDLETAYPQIRVGSSTYIGTDFFPRRT
jgi:hypothetical protein